MGMDDDSADEAGPTDKDIFLLETPLLSMHYLNAFSP